MKQIHETPRNKKNVIMIIFCEVTGEKTQGHISHWLQIPDNSCRKIIAGVSRFPKDKCIIYSSKSPTKY